MGQQSIIHAVKIKPRPALSEPRTSLIEENDELSGKPLSETLTDSMFSSDDSMRSNTSGLEESSSKTTG